jgi:hypothetical protein
MVEYVTKKLLTVPTLKLVEGKTVHIKVVDAMRLGKPGKPDKDGKSKDPATIVSVINLDDGEQMQVVVPAVLKSVWNEDYTDGAYVGACFAVTKLGRNPGKSYIDYKVIEIEDPTAAATPAARRTRAG